MIYLISLAFLKKDKGMAVIVSLNIFLDKTTVVCDERNDEGVGGT